MIWPSLAARMEQRDFPSCLWINRRATSFFPKRTGRPGQCEIAFGGRAVGADGDDVVDVKGRRLPDLSEAAVFAASVGSLNDQPT